MASRVVCMLFLVLLNLNLSWAQRTTGAQKSQCFHSGLFMTQEELRRLKTSDKLPFSRVYTLSSYRKEMTQRETCGVSVVQDTAVLEECGATTYRRLLAKRASGVCQPCCTTEMSFSVPLTVTDVYTGEEVQAKHFTNSSQVMHLGHCVSEGAPCGFEGTCHQATRIAWVLVSGNSGDYLCPPPSPVTAPASTPESPVYT